MSSCRCKKDQDYRFQLHSKAVVHAATVSALRYDHKIWSGSQRFYITIIPKGEDAIQPACGRDLYPLKGNEHRLVPKNTTITCKSCQAAMGFNDEEPHPVRYVVVDKTTGLFYRKTGCSLWVSEITNATMYKTKAILNNFTREAYYDDNEEEISKEEWHDLRNNGALDFSYKYVPDTDRYKIKRITLIVEDDDVVEATSDKNKSK